VERHCFDTIRDIELVADTGEAVANRRPAAAYANADLRTGTVYRQPMHHCPSSFGQRFGAGSHAVRPHAVHLSLKLSPAAC
jgi:hypothetical protein